MTPHTPARRPVGLLPALLAALVVLAALAGVPSRDTVPRLASVANGEISRQEVLLRAKSWVDAQVPYSQSSYYANRYGSYRQDCSGYVSMAWHLGSSLTTATLPNVSHVIDRADLQPGDILWRRDSSVQHAALFLRWADVARTQPVVREEYDYGHPATERAWSASYAGTFTPRRYNGIDGQTTSPGSWAGQDVDGKLVYLTTDADGTIAHGWQQTPGTDPWESTDLGGDLTGQPATALDVTGKLVYFGRTPDGTIAYGWQSVPGSGPWLSAVLPSSTDTDGVTAVTIAGDPAAALDARGRLTAFARTTDGTLYHAWQDAPGSDPWHATLIRDAGTGAPARIAGDPVVSQDITGRLTFVALTSDGSLLHGWQDAPGTGPWHTAIVDGPDVGGPKLVSRPAVALDVSGKLCYFAVTADGQLRHGWQSAPGTGPWQQTTIPPTTDTDGVTTVVPTGDPTAGLDTSGKLTYLVRTTAGTLLHGWQDVPGSAPWHATILSNVDTGQPVVAAGDPVEYQDISGKLCFFARAGATTLVHGWQDAPGTGPWHTTTIVTA